MKNLYTILITSLIMLLAMGTSCSEKSTVDACADGFNFYLALNEEIVAVSLAGTTYTNDPTPANCEAYRNALMNYLNEARDLEDCARKVGQGDDWLMEIEAAEESIQDLQC